MPTTVQGIPLHPLLIHVVVVMVPLAALMLIASALWPAARRRLGVGTPLVALVALVTVPVATNAGNWLKARLPHNPLIERHAHLGGQMLFYAIGLFVVAALVWALGYLRDKEHGHAGNAILRRSLGRVSMPAAANKGVIVVLAVLAIGISVASVVQVCRVGDSGSKALWQGVGGSGN